MSFGDFFSGIGDDIGNFFGGGASDPATSTPADAGAGATPPVSSGGSSFDLGSLLGNSGASSTGNLIFAGGGGTPTTAAGSSLAPSQVAAFMNPTGGGTSAAAAPSFADTGSGAGNTNSVLSTSGQPQTQTPGTLQQITSALGLGNATGGDLLKGALGAGGLAYSAVKGGETTSAEKALKAQAANQSTQGQQLQSYLANGTLPPGAQAYVDQQVAAQKAAIQSKYAGLGMTGSTAEIQELNNVDTQATTQMFQIASQLYTNGVSETGASSQLYGLLMDGQNQNNTQIGSAISNFVAALGGGNPVKTAV